MAFPGLYPPIEPFATERFAVSPLHTLHVEQCGNPAGIPVLFLHGGPGAGCSPASRRFFAPRAFRAIFVDQRGAGRSTPAGEVRDNTTADLIDDFERIREHLGLSGWHLFGGSWGSALAMRYAQCHPERVLSLCLRGIWLLRQFEIDWLMRGLAALAPEAWRAFADAVPTDRRHELLDAYWDLLQGPDPAAARTAARAWATYAAATGTLLPRPDMAAQMTSDAASWSLARIEVHYLRNNRFAPDDLLLRELPRIRHLPTFLVHGRYDLISPLRGADDLHRAWPEADYVVVDDAGHSAHEPGIARELVAAMDRVARTGSPRR